MSSIPFWSRTLEELFSELRASELGLSNDEARKRLSSFSKRKRISKNDSLSLLADQFKSPIVILLLATAGLSFYLKDTTDSVLIFLIVFITGALSFWQENGARNAVASLLSTISTKCDVIRDNKPMEVNLDEVIAGDIVVLSAGATIPADCRLIESKDLYVDEAALTGETFPAEKHVGVVTEDSGISKRSNCVFAGTHVISGMARALVVHGKDESEFGKISQRLLSKPPETDFERGIRSFGYYLMEVTLLLVLAIFAINVFLHRPVLESFMFSLALGVGLTPQLLPAIISINLAAGAKKMAASKVIVKRLSSIQNFGAMNVLCTDKTGTLTEGLIEIKSSLDAEGNASSDVERLAFLSASYQTGFKNPIDESILKHCKTSIDNYQRVDEIPYDFIRKRLSVLVHETSQVQNQLITKGALLNVLEVCTAAETSSGSIPLLEVRARIDSTMADLSAQGNRVLGVAYKKMNVSAIKASDENEMIFAGFLVLSDPPKEGIAGTISELNDLGVQLKIITGDNSLVATEIAKRVGFSNPRVTNSRELRDMKPEALVNFSNSIDVFAEIEPNQKEQIILALKKSGNVVGYIGDGINDAPALHAADIGISVNNAVDVAKEAAQLVMLEHNLQVLVEGIKEGRRTFANTMKYVFMATSANFGNMFSMAGASLFLPFLPLLPHQILLTNFMTDFPEMTISTDQVDDDMVKQPMRWDIRQIRYFMLTGGTLSSVFDFLTFYALFGVLHASSEQFRAGWFAESVISASAVVLIIRTRKSFLASRPSTLLSLATGLTSAAAIILPFTPLGQLIGFAKLPADFIGILAVILVSYLASAELLKHMFHKWMNSQKS